MHPVSEPTVVFAFTASLPGVPVTSSAALRRIVVLALATSLITAGVPAYAQIRDSGAVVTETDPDPASGLTEPRSPDFAEVQIDEVQNPNQELPETAATQVADPAGLPASLLEDVGPLGARMGQGLDRLLETGDPQVPTPQETDLVQRAKAGEDISESAAAAFDQGSLTGAAARGSTSGEQAHISTAAFQPSGIQGMDVSSHQGTVDWRTAWNQGSRFAYVKATEGTYYTNPDFRTQYTGSASVGMYRGAYHFAIPSPGTGAADANFFLDNGGMWTPDGMTLPPLLDIEYNPYPQLGDTCYNMGPVAMTSWIADFSRTVKARTGRLPAIYTTTDWWSRCTGNTSAFSDHALHIASYAPQVGPLPRGWARYSIWQYSSTGPFVGDSNVWYAGPTELAAFAKGSDPISDKYAALGGASSRLGAVTRAQDCTLSSGRGCFVMYQGGSIFWTAGTGAHTVYSSGIGSLWWNQGNVTGRLGFPTGDESCGTTVCQQSFEGGDVIWRQSTGTIQVFRTAIGTLWRQLGSGAGILGYPLGMESCGPALCTMEFDTGTIYWSAQAGATSVRDGRISAAWESRGGKDGRLGYPTGNEACSWGVCSQSFQGGDLVQNVDGVTHAVYRSSIGTSWMAMGGRNSQLGDPQDEESCDGSVCRQLFANGLIFWTPVTGSWTTARTIFEKWMQEGGRSGRLGAPLSAATLCKTNAGCRQEFAGGIILAPNAGTSASVIRPASSIGQKWQRGGSESGRLSYPRGDESCQGAVCQQSFINGSIYWTSESGSWPTYNNAITGRWQSLGGGQGRMGYPTSDEFCGSVACWQSFQGGDVLWSTVASAHGVFSTSAIGARWRYHGAQYGQLRFPLSEETCGTTSCSQTFEGGTIRWDARTGLTVDFR